MNILLGKEIQSMNEFELKITKKEIIITLSLIALIIGSIFIINDIDFRNKKNAIQELMTEIEKSQELDSILNTNFYEDTSYSEVERVKDLIKNLQNSEKLSQKVGFYVDSYFPAGKNRSDSCYYFDAYDNDRAFLRLKSYDIIEKTKFNKALAEGIKWDEINNKKDLDHLKSYHYNPDSKNLVIISYRIFN